MNWKQLKQLLASGEHHYDPELLENSPLGLKRYAAIARDAARLRQRSLGRHRTLDNTATALLYRMGAGFPGEVNRFHPVSIEPCLIDVNAPPLFFGQGVVIDATTQGVRPLVAGDVALTDVYGITVRPFPTQQQSGGMSSSFGSGTPPASGIMDVMRSGYIMVQFNNVGSAPVKGGQMYIWTAVTSGNHTQGLWETAATGGSTAAIGAPPRKTYQGGWDASNVGEIAYA